MKSWWCSRRSRMAESAVALERRRRKLEKGLWSGPVHPVTPPGHRKEFLHVQVHSPHLTEVPEQFYVSARV